MKYGMFTPEGDAEVANIVNTILRHAPPTEQRWPAAHVALMVLAKDKRFAEATDTAVREAVYNGLEATGNFYI